MPAQFVFFLPSSPLVSSRLQSPSPGPMGGKETPPPPTPPPGHPQGSSCIRHPGTHSADGPSEMREPGTTGYLSGEHAHQHLLVLDFSVDQARRPTRRKPPIREIKCASAGDAKQLGPRVA
ncbi:hypothetical protein BDP55DRAFT_638418 [Colletotrichum godetiae]|uniref:Uncharacterized protein n=1 Tax=Colletotrichum godetiae TaxID=1209918 RepID=A0AAJ0EMS5_9PEZI|nr:uncharacterized protein BDP55DRAFT_638418 [Colletotrichum godetiae]KAK1657796.1 hypothetical protein BDP55DRAFT_638418 [Colletotrichum godetiae]